MSRVFDGTNDYSNAPIGSMPTSVPLTISAWVKLTSGWTGYGTIVKVGDFDNYKDFFRIQARNTGSTTRFEASSHHGSMKTAQHGSTITDGQWYHVCGVFTSTTSRQIYVNGVAGTENTATSEPDAADFSHISVGASKVSGSADTTAYLKGEVSEVAVWNVALSTSEIDSLKNGASAMIVRDDGLKAYYPVDGMYGGSTESDIDYMGGDSLSPSGSTLSFDSQPVIDYPSFPIVKRFASSASTALIKVIQAYYAGNR